MLAKEENDLITQTDPGTPCGELMRRYWQPAALSEELPPGGMPLPVRLLGEDLVLFRDDQGRPGLLSVHCSHRGADLSYGRVEDGGIRCLYHGWLYDVHGRCLEQPGEPAFRWTDSGGRDSPEPSGLEAQAQTGSFHEKIRHKAYPCVERNGLILTCLGPGEPPLLPNYEFLRLPEDHVYAVKLYSECNWLQGNEGNVDLLHTSFLHYSNRDLHDSGRPASGNSSQSHGAPSLLNSRGSGPSMERCEAELIPLGLRVCKIRKYVPEEDYIRIGTVLIPNLTAVPGGQTNWHVPIDDTHHWKYTIIIDTDRPLDRERVSRRQTMDAHYRAIANKSNRYLQDRELMKSVSYSGISPSYFQQQDLCATEAWPIQDRTQEHLVASDAAIVTYRKLLVAAIKDAQEGRDPPGVFRDSASNHFRGAVTTSGTIPARLGWKAHCRELVEQGRGWVGGRQQ